MKSPHHGPEHCAACAEAAAKFPAPGAPPAMDPARLRAVREAALAELSRQPVQRGWRTDSGAFALTVALLATAATALHGGFDPSYRTAPLLAHASLALALLLAALAALAPGHSNLRRGVLCFGAASLLAAVLSRGAPPAAWLAKHFACAVWVAATALIPLAAGSFLLGGFARSRAREALVGLASGGIGVLSLGLTCPGDSAVHVGVFHVGSFLAVAGLAVLVGGRIPRRSYAP